MRISPAANAGRDLLFEEGRMIALIVAGDASLFRDLIRPYHSVTLALAKSFLHNDADAEDATQDALLKAFRNLAKFRCEAKFSTWLITIVLNEARTRLRGNKRLRTESLDEILESDRRLWTHIIRDKKDIPSQSYERKKVCQHLWEAISALPPTYRAVFMLRDIEGLCSVDTATSLSISVTSVKTRLHRARRMLRTKLALNASEVKTALERPHGLHTLSVHKLSKHVSADANETISQECRPTATAYRKEQHSPHSAPPFRKNQAASQHA